MYNTCGIYTPPQSTGGGGSGTGFTAVVANYSALPDPTTVPNEFYFVENSQGISWLPGTLGGTYYPAGTYYSDGLTWITGFSPYQATLATVNAGIVTDQFVSPYTFANASKWNNYQLLSGKNAANGYMGLGSTYRPQMANDAGTVLSTWQSLATTTRNWAFPDADGTVALTSDIPSLAGYVPYTGATANVNLGVFNLITPKIYGGVAVGSTLDLVGTSANGTASVAAINFKVGNNGATLAGSIYNNGQLLYGTATAPLGALAIPFRLGSGTNTIDFGSYNANYSAIWFNQGTPSVSNFGFLGNSSTSYLNATGSVYVSISGVGKIATDSNGTRIGDSSTPTSRLDVAGSLSIAYVAKTANYTATISDYTINCTSNTFTVTLPTAVGITGRIYNIKNSGTGVITVATTSSQTIDGQASGALTLVQYENLTIQSNGANWIIL